MRIMALWFPDWPVHTAQLEHPGYASLAIAFDHHVWACSQQARQQGVRRGMKVRAAQALSPTLKVVDRDIERDARCFEQVVQALDDVVASIEVMRPGLAVVDAQAAARFHGSEEQATQLLIDAAAQRGVDSFAGVADSIATAILAARLGQIVPADSAQAFLAEVPTSTLLAEESLGCDADTIHALEQLGLHTLGAVAQLPSASVTTRFGAHGQRIHHIARGALDRKVAPALAGTPLAVTVTPADAINRVDSAAFIARGLAAQLHESLRATGVVCQRLKVSALLTVDGKEQQLERIWRTREPLSEAATADRVRWQLDGWLTSRALAGESDTEEEVAGDGIISLTLDPLEVTAPEADSLWGGTDERLAEVRRVVSRVQSTLGVDAVLQPIAAGGRGPLERVELVPYGEDRAPSRPLGTWRGALPGPLPARRGGSIHVGGRHPASAFQLYDAQGNTIIVTAEAVLNSQPEWAVWGAKRCRVVAWAGPWPVDERWWDPAEARKCARLQLVVEDDGAPRAFLLLWLAGRWRVEAAYD